MLNDAFILGGVNTGKQFVFTPVGDDLAYFRSLAAGAAAGAGASKEQRIQSALPVWKQFFLNKSYQLWDRGYPRVFVRELLGLAKFGYKAAPTEFNLSFDCPDPSGQPTCTFDQYLSELTQREFQANKIRPILTRIAEYLFGDPSALDPIIR